MDDLTDFTIDFVTTADGSKIGYRRIGAGPGIVLVHGALQSSTNFTRLAKALASQFTVYIPDRRGRPLSAPYQGREDLQSEASDVQTLVRHAHASYIFGLSSGAIIALQVALNEPSIKKVALYEPPIPLNDTAFKKLDTDYEQAIREKNMGKAFVAILKGTGDTSFFSRLPAFILSPFINMMMRAQKKKPAEGEPALADMVATFHYDRIVSKQSEALIKESKKLTVPVLLMGGSKSQSFLKIVLDQLQAAIPNATRITFPKQGHLASDNSGDPQKVADELIRFFGQRKPIP
jgi:pimeloyl-ACP methyl ester carboxylesterase